VLVGFGVLSEGELTVKELASGEGEDLREGEE
jgi:hypothetical protein